MPYIQQLWFWDEVVYRRWSAGYAPATGITALEEEPVGRETEGVDILLAMTSPDLSSHCQRRTSQQQASATDLSAYTRSSFGVW